MDHDTNIKQEEKQEEEEEEEEEDEKMITDSDEDCSSLSDVEELVGQTKPSEKLPVNVTSKLSEKAYYMAYQAYKNWRAKNGRIETDEKVLLDYFAHQSKTCRPSSLWSTYSKLKSMLRVKEDLDISSYKTVVQYIKLRGRGYSDKDENRFTHEQVHDFLTNASDQEYLIDKIILIFGICGALRCQELVNINTSHVQEHGQTFLVTIKKKGAKCTGSFNTNPEYYYLIKKYISLRPLLFFTDRFFIGFKHGQCVKQVIGKNAFAKTPQRVAEYLKLPGAKKFTGHAFRRTASKIKFNCRRVWQSNSFGETRTSSSTKTSSLKIIDTTQQINQPAYSHNNSMEQEITASSDDVTQIFVKEEFDFEQQSSAISSINPLEYYSSLESSGIF